MSTEIPSLNDLATLRDKHLADVRQYLEAAMLALDAGNLDVIRLTLWGALDSHTNAEICDETIRETVAHM